MFTQKSWSGELREMYCRDPILVIEGATAKGEIRLAKADMLSKGVTLGGTKMSQNTVDTPMRFLLKNGTIFIECPQMWVWPQALVRGIHPTPPPRQPEPPPPGASQKEPKGWGEEGGGGWGGKGCGVGRVLQLQGGGLEGTLQAAVEARPTSGRSRF